MREQQACFLVYRIMKSSNSFRSGPVEKMRKWQKPAIRFFAMENTIISRPCVPAECPMETPPCWGTSAVITTTQYYSADNTGHMHVTYVRVVKINSWHYFVRWSNRPDPNAESAVWLSADTKRSLQIIRNECPAVPGSETILRCTRYENNNIVHRGFGVVVGRNAASVHVIFVSDWRQTVLLRRVIALC